MMGDECFVCQSKSSQSADDGSPSAKRRKKGDNNYKNLDSSTWKIFCHYFYPPPLVGLLDDSLFSSSPQIEDFSRMPVFCGTCWQTIVNLCNLHSQLELIQSQISKIVAQVSVTFVQEEGDNRDIEEDNNSSNYNRLFTTCDQIKLEEGQGKSEDDMIYSMRRIIRQRYQPSVCLSRIETSVDEEHLNDWESIHEIPDLPARDIVTRKRAPRKVKNASDNESVISSEDEGGHGNQGFDSDSDYEPDCDDNKLVAEKKDPLPKSKSQNKVQTKSKSSPKKKGASKKKSKNSPRGSYKKRKDKDDEDLLKPTKDPKVGENIYEFGGKWRYEKKLDDSGTVAIFSCLSCPKNFGLRRQIVRHIKLSHINETVHHRQRAYKIDDNNFTYDGTYSITRVTESNGVFYKCGTCLALKKTLAMAKAHLREVHIEPNKFVCHICGYAASLKKKLVDHMVTHSEGRKYVCEQCGKSFKHQKNLIDHKESHLDQPFFCDVCGLKFVYKKGLRRHQQTVGHRPPEVAPTPDQTAPFVPKACSFCTREFVTEESLRNHTPICQGRVKIQCDWCLGMYFHLKIHKQRRCKERFNKQNLTETERAVQDLNKIPFNEEDEGKNNK